MKTRIKVSENNEYYNIIFFNDEQQPKSNRLSLSKKIGRRTPNSCDNIVGFKFSTTIYSGEK